MFWLRNLALALAEIVLVEIILSVKDVFPEARAQALADIRKRNHDRRQRNQG